jgi:hypothetical protein
LGFFLRARPGQATREGRSMDFFVGVV